MLWGLSGKLAAMQSSIRIATHQHWNWGDGGESNLGHFVNSWISGCLVLLDYNFLPLSVSALSISQIIDFWIYGIIDFWIYRFLDLCNFWIRELLFSGFINFWIVRFLNWLISSLLGGMSPCRFYYMGVVALSFFARSVYTCRSSWGAFERLHSWVSGSANVCPSLVSFIPNSVWSQNLLEGHHVFHVWPFFFQGGGA